MSEWISVDDRLPEEKQKVLAFRGGVYVLAYRKQLEELWDKVGVFWQSLPAPPSPSHKESRE